MLENPRAERRSMKMNGYKVRYWFYDIDSRNKPLLVMTHGFRGDHHGLQLIADALRAKYHVVVPDLPGFGLSEPFPQGNHDVASYVTFLRRFIEQLTDGAVSPTSETGIALLGHSFGSTITAHLAAQSPSMVERLILINPISQPALTTSRAFTAAIADAYYSLGAKLPFGFGDKLLRSNIATDIMSREMTTTDDPDIQEYILNQHRAYFGRYSDNRVIQEAYQASSTRTVAEVAPLLIMPTLLITGGKDPIGTLESQKRMASWIQRHKHHDFPNTGHLIHYEKAAETAQLIEEFLTGPAPNPIEIHDNLPRLDITSPNTSQITQLLPVIKKRRKI